MCLCATNVSVGIAGAVAPQKLSSQSCGSVHMLIVFGEGPFHSKGTGGKLASCGQLWRQCTEKQTYGR